MASLAGEKMARVCDFWGRRVHIYVGLYFTLAVWFFSLSGLALNRPEWFYSKDGPASTESTREGPIRALDSSEGGEIVADLMIQLELTGELDRFWLDTEKNTLWFRITRPGSRTDVNADLVGLTAKVSTVDWGPGMTAYTLHSFTGVGPWRDRGQGATPERDWVASYLWVWSMDGVCIGLLYMVVSGIYMWLRQPDKRVAGSVALVVGIAGCAFFMFGIG